MDSGRHEMIGNARISARVFLLLLVTAVSGWAQEDGLSLEIDEKAFVVADTSSEIGRIVIREGTTPVVVQGTLLGIVIPDTLDLEWVPGVEGQIGGSAAGKIGSGEDARRFGEGNKVFLIEVEADVSIGLGAFSIVGLPDGTIKESRDRIMAALNNACGGFPIRKVVVNLAPADIRKTGTGFDLPIAMAILEAGKVIPAKSLQEPSLSANSRWKA